MTERETTQEAHRLLTAYDTQLREAAELTGNQLLSLPSARHRTLAVLAVQDTTRSREATMREQACNT